jgi:hypothetical protein
MKTEVFRLRLHPTGVVYLFLWLTMFPGCGRNSDVQIPLPGFFRVDRTREGQFLYCQGLWGGNPLPIPVESLWWNEQVIVAKLRKGTGTANVQDGGGYYLVEVDSARVQRCMSEDALRGALQALGCRGGEDLLLGRRASIQRREKELGFVFSERNVRAYMTCQEDLLRIARGIYVYYESNHQLPVGLSSLSGEYRVPSDPWGNPYQYEVCPQQPAVERRPAGGSQVGTRVPDYILRSKGPCVRSPITVPSYVRQGSRTAATEETL